MKNMKELEKYSQCIVVDSKEKKMTLFDKGKLICEINNVALGKNGCTDKKIEGDGCTPLGDFPIGFAFGFSDLTISYPYYKITSDIYFVSDSDSPYYNEWVSLGEKTENFLYSYMKTSANIAWKEAEHLCDYPVAYQFGLVIEYNMNPRTKGKGSAIFLHVKGKDYTEGCVAVHREEMQFILNWIQDRSAHIIIF